MTHDGVLVVLCPSRSVFGPGSLGGESLNDERWPLHHNNGCLVTHVIRGRSVGMLKGTSGRTTHQNIIHTAPQQFTIQHPQ